MKTLETQGNFFVILNEDNSEFSRHPSWDCRYQIYNELSEDPSFKFFGTESEFNTKNDEESEFLFSEISGFLSVSELKDYLNDNLAFSKGGGVGNGGTETASRNGVEDQNSTNAPVALLPDAYSFLLNNGLGPSTIINLLPLNTAPTWDLVNNQFDFSSLTVGTWITMRLDFDLTTSSGNTDFVCAMDFIIGQPTAFTKVLGRRFFKNNKVYLGETVTFGFYIGSEATMNNPAKIKVKTDSNTTFKLNGWAMGINVR